MNNAAINTIVLCGILLISAIDIAINSMREYLSRREDERWDRTFRREEKRIWGR